MKNSWQIQIIFIQSLLLLPTGRHRTRSVGSECSDVNLNLRHTKGTSSVEPQTVSCKREPLLDLYCFTKLPQVWWLTHQFYHPAWSDYQQGESRQRGCFFWRVSGIGFCALLASGTRMYSLACGCFLQNQQLLDHSESLQH